MAKQTSKDRSAAGAAATATANGPTQPIRRNSDAPRRAAAADGENNPGVENLDKVRDILFGSQLRDNERRFARVEERMAKDTSDLRDELRKRLDSLEAHVRKETASLLERIKTEQSQRSDAVQTVTHELRELGKTLQQKAAELHERADEFQRELRQELLEQSKSLREEQQQGRVETAAEIEQAAAELRASKLDRSALADLFAEMAARLGDNPS